MEPAQLEKGIAMSWLSDLFGGSGGKSKAWYAAQKKQAEDRAADQAKKDAAAAAEAAARQAAAEQRAAAEKAASDAELAKTLQGLQDFGKSLLSTTASVSQDQVTKIQESISAAMSDADKAVTETPPEAKATPLPPSASAAYQKESVKRRRTSSRGRNISSTILTPLGGGTISTLGG